MPALLSTVSVQGDGAMRFEASLSSPRMVRMREHVVRGRPLLPAAAFVETMLSALSCAATMLCSVAGLRITAPLLLDGETATMQCVLWPHTGTVLVCSSQAREHAVGTATTVASLTGKRTPLLFAVDAKPHQAAAADIAAAMEPDTGAYLVHPARLDACLQLGALDRRLRGLHVPVGAAMATVGAACQHMHAACMVGDAVLHIRADGLRLNRVGLQRMGVEEPVFPPGLLTRLISEATQPAVAPHAPPLLEVATRSPLQSATAVLQAAQALDTACWAGANAVHLAILRCQKMEGQRVGNDATGAVPRLTAGECSSGEGLYGQQHAHSVQLQQRYATLGAPLTGDVHIVARPPGSLSSLFATPVHTSVDATMLRIGAVGINFRDLLNVMVRVFSTDQRIPPPQQQGLYPGDAGAPGSDCAGITTHAQGAFAVGDRAFGYAQGALGTAAPASLLTPTPTSLAQDAAATTTTVFLTVDAALSAASGMQRGDSLLVHAVTGGVGGAAVQVAAARGLEVLATAGSARKRALARADGVACVANSRDTAFAAVLATRATAVDCVLNSLTGSSII